MKTGERLVGEISSLSTDATLVLESKLLGELRLPRSEILGIEADKPDSAAVGVVVPDKPKPPKKESQQVASKPKPKPKEEPKPVKTIELTQEEVEHIKERRILETLRDLQAPEAWKGDLRMGMNLSKGDKRWTESFARGKLEIDPKGSLNFYRFTGSYTYRQTEKSNGDTYKSTDRYDGTFIYRRSFFDDWFVQNSLGGRVDQIKGIDREVQELVGLGYSFEPTPKFELIFGGGGGVEDFESNSDDTRNGLHPVANIFQEFSWKPLKRTSFVQKFNYYWNPNNTQQYNYVLTAAIRYRITDLLGFEFSFNQDFDNDIGDGSARDDLTLRNAIIVYF
ncbi:DUF481 domain-containing protein [Coraliomargarita parva]|uniref:DUF481 domain-containing protein n=1 Tax=Coraliomargarita parva TaxID=3014050 RepID=UPI0022B45F76|nr:DUF481 domain-containing protein [Coraliomargarita parva]